MCLRSPVVHAVASCALLAQRPTRGVLIKGARKKYSYDLFLRLRGALRLPGATICVGVEYYTH